MESSAEDERLVQRWAAAWSSHDVDALLDCFTDDCVYEDVTLGLVNHGKEELRIFAQTFLAFSPDLVLELKNVASSGWFAGGEWIFSGTQHKEFMGKPSTGKRWSVRGASCFELRDSKIYRCSDYWNLTTFLDQLG